MATPAELIAQSLAHYREANRIDGTRASYRKDNPGEFVSVMAYLDGGPRPSNVTSDMGLGLVLEEDARRALDPAEPSPPPPPPPPPPGDAYFVTDYSSGKFVSPWVRLHNSSGQQGVNVAQTPDGRVAVADNPSGSGKVARFEIRDSDPGWPPKPDVQKSEAVSTAGHTWNKSGVAYGDVRWFSTQIYFPYNATEKFEWATGGDDFMSLMELHTASSTGWSSQQFGWGAWQAHTNRWLNFLVYGGAVHSTSNFRQINLLQMTDGAGNRIMSAFNRWINLVWGIKFAADSSGWMECWVDGVNVYPRTNGPTMWTGDFGMYFKQGLYKDKASPFPGGRSVLYFGQTTIGLDKP